MFQSFIAIMLSLIFSIDGYSQNMKFDTIAVAKLITIENIVESMDGDFADATNKMCLQDINDVLSGKALNYKITKEFALKDFELYLFVDKSIHQLHSTSFDFLYKEGETKNFLQCKKYEPGNTVKFINEKFRVDELSIEEKLKLIDLYWILEFTYQEFTYITSGYKVEFLTETNRSEFKYIKNHNLWIKPIQKYSDSLVRLYKVETDSSVEYKEITFAFDDHKFSVYESTYLKLDLDNFNN